MTEVAAEARPVRWGLAAKLFAILLLLGAVAVMITGVLGYIRAREALERAMTLTVEEAPVRVVLDSATVHWAE